MKNILVQVLSLVAVGIIAAEAAIECAKKFPPYVDGSFVCVCNATYCDTIAPIDADKIDKSTVYIEYVTTKRVHRLARFTGKLDDQVQSISSLNLTINPSKKYQRILGFGGAMTDATGLMVFDLPADAILNFLKSYFDPSGLEYNIIRVPVAGVDFSTRCYSYDDTPDDFNMTDFNLSEEDTGVKIPLIQAAKRLSSKSIKLFASAWSAPPWMKTNNRYDGNGTLKGDPGGIYYQAWALYYVKFFQEYQKRNLTFWAMTAQNEPTDGYIAKFPFNGMGFTPETQSEFIVTNLGPSLEANGFGDIKIMILDDQRLFLPSWVERVFAHSPEKAQKYVSGVAVHWYMDSFIPPNVLDKTHEKFPDKWIFATEACTGTVPLIPHVMLGEFSRAESYARDIIEDLNHWTTGWTDWNMALNMEGGPNWAKNYVDSPIIVNTEDQEFYKQPMFYALGHFSKFIQENSIRVDISSSSKLKHVSYVAFDNEDLKQMTFVILNQSDQDYDYSVYEPRIKKYINSHVEAHSIKTLIWYY